MARFEADPALFFFGGGWAKRPTGRFFPCTVIGTMLEIAKNLKSWVVSGGKTMVLDLLGDMDPCPTPPGPPKRGQRGSFPPTFARLN